MRTTYYTVQVLEEGLPKNIPHTKGTKNCEFLNRKDAVKFLNELIENNPKNMFRLMSRCEVYKSEKWMQCLPKTPNL